MQSQWTDWLRELARGGQGGSDMSLPPITRGVAWSHTLAFEADVSADAFSANLRLTPDYDATPLATITVSVGAYADGVTLVALSMSAATAQLSGAPDGDGDALAEVIFSLFHTPSGGTQYRAAACSIAIAE